jgi:hypothetical protein
MVSVELFVVARIPGIAECLRKGMYIKKIDITFKGENYDHTPHCQNIQKSPHC